MPGPKDRYKVKLKIGDEIVIRNVGGHPRMAGVSYKRARPWPGRSIIIRAVGGGFQVFGKEYLSARAEKLFAGNIHGGVVSSTIGIHYKKDIPDEDVTFYEI